MTENRTLNAVVQLRKYGSASLGVAAVIAMTSLGVNASRLGNEVERQSSASPMQTGQTMKPTAAPKEPPTAKAVPPVTGPARLPAEQESARD